MKLDAARLDDLKVEGRRVLVRVDFNCPQDEAGAISDDTRVRAALPTIKELLARGATPVLMSHLGRPKGKVVESMRLEPMGARLQELLGSPVLRLKESTGTAVQQAIAAAPRGSNGHSGQPLPTCGVGAGTMPSAGAQSAGGRRPFQTPVLVVASSGSSDGSLLIRMAIV